MGGRGWGGNITAWDWQHKNAGTTLPASSYSFTYDGISRLTGTAPTDPNGEHGITYDKHGNILTLTRSGANAATVDDLSFRYNGNRRTGYWYDPNGNTTYDRRNDLEISYNFLNLVSQVKDGTTDAIRAEYQWLADGTKLSATTPTGNGYDYVGSLIYSRLGGGTAATRELESVGFSGGRIVKTSSGYEVNYFITDHLGSTRVVFSQNLTDLQRNDYYPFGLQIGIQGGNNRYLYNGKESQVSLGSDYLDYGARMRGSDMWLTIDPLAEKYPWISPYAFALNNPLRYVDWDGRKPDEYYDLLNGKYLGSDDATTSDMRQISAEKYNEILGGNPLTATAELQSNSTVITINETQIQSAVQSVADNSRTSGLEYSTVLVYDSENAEVRAEPGLIGVNDQTMLEYFPGPIAGANFHGAPGGPIIIGQAHGHPASSDPNHITQKTMSGYDVNAATSMQIPIYGIDAMSGRVGRSANIHRANPDGSISHKVGTTQTIHMGRDAMQIWGRSNKPTF